MPRYTPPGSDSDRLSTLKTVLETTADGNDLAAFILPATRAKIVEFVPGYETGIQAVDTESAGRAKEVSEKDKALDFLKDNVRDFFEVLRRRTNRLEHNVSVLVHYNLPQSGDNPPLGAEDEFVKAAENIVAGEPNAVGAGFPAMANPAAADVATALAAFNTERGDVAPADEKVRKAEGEVAKLRPEADKLIRKAKRGVEFLMDDESAPSQRRVLRRMGYKFAPLPGETPEPEESEPES
ncbi:MAG: hypothetical protein ACI8UO_004875 [Verrucomicrobiales bacterium]|jgi:hypothetical protein